MFELMKCKMEKDSIDYEETISTIADEDLIGAEIIAVTPFSRNNLKTDDLDEIEIKLKDGRHLNLNSFGEEITLTEWEDIKHG